MIAAENMSSQAAGSGTGARDKTPVASLKVHWRGPSVKVHKSADCWKGAPPDVWSEKDGS
jgi:hypothetical protein